MKILNLGCGGNFLPPPFVNIDSLFELFAAETERRRLFLNYSLAHEPIDDETRGNYSRELDQLDVELDKRKQRTVENVEYIEADLRKGIPLPDNCCDGILASHLIEHLDVHESIKLISECHRVLVQEGLLVISVPNTSYFRKVHHMDTKENSGELFGEQMDEGNPNKSFFDCALFFNEHKQMLTEDALWCLMVKGGFGQVTFNSIDSVVGTLLKKELNRLKFSLVMWGVK